MQLRTNRKQKSPDLEDLGFENHYTKPRKKSYSKNANNDKGGINDNLPDFLKDLDTKSKHKLRNHPLDYSGKYKKMNSGKYMYQTSSNEKKPIFPKKVSLKAVPAHNRQPQLRILHHEALANFKKFLTKLYKKEEENLLNKKKKREETKQKIKLEKRMQRNANSNAYYQNMLYQQLSNIPQIGYMEGYPGYFAYSGIPYQQFYNPYFFYQNYQETIRESMEECLKKIQSRGIVNNIIAALYIKEEQEKEKIENKRNSFQGKPSSSSINNNGNTNQESQKENLEANPNLEDKKQDDVQVNDEKNIEQKNEMENNKELNSNLEKKEENDVKVEDDISKNNPNEVKNNTTDMELEKDIVAKVAEDCGKKVENLNVNQ